MSVLSRFWPLASWSSPQKDRSLREPFQPCQPARDLQVSPIKRQLGVDQALLNDRKTKHPSGREHLEQAPNAKSPKILEDLKFSKSREFCPGAGPDLGLSPLARQESPLRRKPGPRLVRDLRNSPATVRDLRNSPVRDQRNDPVRDQRKDQVRDLRNRPVRNLRNSTVMTPSLSSSPSRTGPREIVMEKAGVVMARQTADVRASFSLENCHTSLALEVTEEALGLDPREEEVRVV